MKQKIFIRIISIVLAAVLLLSVVFVAVTSLSANAALLSDESQTTGAQIEPDESIGASSSGNASGYINADYVNLRSGAGTNYSVVICMRKNTKFTFVSTTLYNKNWYKIKLNDGKTGYVHKDYAKKDSVSTTNPPSSSSATGYVTDDYVNLRSGAGTNYSVITCMRKNTKFTFVSTSLYSTNWYKIKLNDGKTGYVHKDYVKKDSVSTTNPPSSSSATGYVTDDYVNLRSGAGTNYSVITCMRKNTKFTFVSTSLYSTNWYKIKLNDGKTGYVHKDYVKKDSVSTTNPPATQPSTNPSVQPTTAPVSTGKISLSETSKTIYKGNVYALTAVCSGSVSWSSSDKNVATVSGGVVTAKENGTATITAKSGSNSASCKITVKTGSYVHISNANVSMRWGKSIRLRSNTSGVKWSSSNNKIATVNNGIVDTKGKGKATITAYTSSGAATCLIDVIGRDNIRFCYASPNSAPLNSTVTFKAVTDTDRNAVRFVVSNGSTSYTVEANKKTKDGNNYIWTGSKAISKSGKWTVKAYAKYKTSTQYLTTPVNGEGEVFVTTSSDKTTTVCSERRASDEVINLIANYEGFLSSVTADSITSDPTLGYGKVVTVGEQFYNNLTKNEAYAYLCQTVNSGGYTTRTNKYLLDNGVKFNQRQFDALVCFTYNVGAGVIYNDSEIQSVLLNTAGAGSSADAGKAGYVNSDGVNLRSGAGTNYSVLTCMSANTKFTFVDGKVYNSNWYKIKLSNGTTGYIYKTYVSVSGGSRDLNNINKQDYLDAFLQYHHAAGSCYWGLLYRRIDEAEVFFYGDYDRDGEYNYNHFSFACYANKNFKIG